MLSAGLSAATVGGHRKSSTLKISLWFNRPFPKSAGLFIEEISCRTKWEAQVPQIKVEAFYIYNSILMLFDENMEMVHL